MESIDVEKVFENTLRGEVCSCYETLYKAWRNLVRLETVFDMGRSRELELLSVVLSILKIVCKEVNENGEDISGERN